MRRVFQHDHIALFAGIDAADGLRSTERCGCVDGQCSIGVGADAGSSPGTVEKATLKGLFSLMKQTDIFLNFGY